MTNEEIAEELFPYYEDMEDVELVQTVFKRSGAIEMGKWKDNRFREIVSDYIKLAYDSGQEANMLEDLLNEL